MPTEICTTTSSVERALPLLKASSHLLVDLEGRDLGNEDGALSVISIGTALARDIFIFDVLSLGVEDIRPVLDLISNTHTLKIVWDGRMDAIDFRRTYAVRFGRVLDLQIADIVSRPGRGVEDDVMMHSVPWHPLHPVRYYDTGGVHALVGLKRALESHGVADKPEKGSPSINHQDWMRRPLSRAYLKYAAQDIMLISRVYSHFQSWGFVGTRRCPRPELEAQSLRYVEMHAAPVPNNNGYLKTNILPLEILSEPPEGTTSSCDKCHRLLSPRSFTYYRGERRRRSRVYRTCKVCYLLGERARLNGRTIQSVAAQAGAQSTSLSAPLPQGNNLTRGDGAPHHHDSLARPSTATAAALQDAGGAEGETASTEFWSSHTVAPAAALSAPLSSSRTMTRKTSPVGQMEVIPCDGSEIVAAYMAGRGIHY